MSHNDFQRVNKRTPCPICHKHNWCLVVADGSAAICARVQKGSVKLCGEAGWLHILKHNSHRRMWPRRQTMRRNHSQRILGDLTRMAAQWKNAVSEDNLAALARGLGISPSSLTRLDLGWVSAFELKTLNTTCKGPGCWTFPMVNVSLAGKKLRSDALDASDAKIPTYSNSVIGIRLRTPGGFKYSIRGGKQGLFIPSALTEKGLLLICEGPTDTAAMLDLGFDVIGRPSCSGGVQLLSRWVQSRKPHQVVIVADQDIVGRKGAKALAVALRPYCPCIRIITPPPELKDARAWRQAGVKHKDVIAVIEQAPEVRLTIKTNRRQQQTKLEEQYG